MTTAYTWGKAMGFSAEDGGLWNYIQQQRSYSRLDFDRTSNYTNSFVWELPFGKGKKLAQTGAARWIAGGWQFNGVLSLMTGRPMTFGTNAAANTPGSSFTPDQIGPNELHARRRRDRRNRDLVRHDRLRAGGDRVLLPPASARCDGTTAASAPPAATTSTAPASATSTCRSSASSSSPSASKLEFRAESTNFTNSPAFAQPEPDPRRRELRTLTGTLAGLISNQGVGGTGPRAFNLGLKLTF